MPVSHPGKTSNISFSSGDLRAWTVLLPNRMLFTITLGSGFFP